MAGLNSPDRKEEPEDFDLIFPGNEGKIVHVKDFRNKAFMQAEIEASNGRKVILIKVIPETRMVNELFVFTGI